LILEQLANGVWLLKVNRPEALNALNSTVLNEMGEALRQIGEMVEFGQPLFIVGV
jgi:enoyl-CoA hydratase